LTGRGGYTLIEVLIYLIIGVIIIGSVYQALIGQTRLYSKEREIMDVRTSLRAASELLAVELRMSSPSNGDIYQIWEDSISVRSTKASGIVCGIAMNGRALGLYGTSGVFDNELADSVMVYTGAGSSGWVVTKVQAVALTPIDDLPTCSWNSTPPEWTLAVDTAGGELLSGVQVGSEVRAFRRIRYGTRVIDGRTWLVRGSGVVADVELLTGPLTADSGMVFNYYNAQGDTTTVIADIARVEVFFRGESLNDVRRVGGNPTPQVDSLRINVAVRG
jgi:Tfp pilus assembly protein PilW